MGNFLEYSYVSGIQTWWYKRITDDATAEQKLEPNGSAEIFASSIGVMAVIFQIVARPVIPAIELSRLVG